MTPDDFRRAKEILQGAVDLDADSRAAFLDTACAGDADLRRRVEELLASDQSMGDFLAHPEMELAVATGLEIPRESMAGRTIGSYRIVREIGHGGMGTVYLPERADGQYRRRVAIKLVNPGLGSKDILRRFRNERQVLAGLTHPNIASLLDGGATKEGLPYVVMEYVEGVPLDTWCDSRKLAVRDRLRLFQRVCAAVQYAHEQQVIHRDIKPGNILIAADGTPKLLDFGIAKVVNPDLATGTLEMTVGPGFMTPEYASPEQLRGEQVGAAGDVYSLGVLLYRLLAGQPPFANLGGEMRQLVRLICEQDPVRPSALGKLSELAGDLDDIVLKALRKEPDRRYGSVQEFSEDIDRFLHDEPIQAR